MPSISHFPFNLAPFLMMNRLVLMSSFTLLSIKRLFLTSIVSSNSSEISRFIVLTSPLSLEPSSVLISLSDTMTPSKLPLISYRQSVMIFA
jgi:hypothetical protein